MLTSLLTLLFLAALANNEEFHRSKNDALKKVGDYLKLKMKQEVNPCENFYDHVCGNYENSSIFRGSYGQQLEFIYDTLNEAINKTLLNTSSQPYKRLAIVFYEQCNSLNKDLNRKKILNEALSARIEIELSALLSENETELANLTEVWRFVGTLKRELDLEILVGWYSQETDNEFGILSRLGQNLPTICYMKATDSEFLELIEFNETDQIKKN